MRRITELIEGPGILKGQTALVLLRQPAPKLSIYGLNPGPEQSCPLKKFNGPTRPNGLDLLNETAFLKAFPNCLDGLPLIQMRYLAWMAH